MTYSLGYTRRKSRLLNPSKSAGSTYCVKLESILKQGKAPRVIDEGFARVAVNAVFGHIVDHVHFGESPDFPEPSVEQPNSQKVTVSRADHGAVSQFSIKRKLRHEIIDDLADSLVKCRRISTVWSAGAGVGVQR